MLSRASIYFGNKGFTIPVQWLWSGLVGQVLTACPTIEKVGEHSEVGG